MHMTDIKRDCRFYRGEVPCLPNKLRAQVCPSCDEYQPIQTRILIIKLGAAGDVIRTTPLLRRLRQEYPGAHISWLTLTPEVLPASQVDKIYPFDFRSIYVLSHLPFDLVINLDKDLEACALARDLAAPRKCGFLLDHGQLAAATPAAEHKLLTGAFDQLSRANRQSYLEEIFAICGFEFRGERYVLELDPAQAEAWQSLQALADSRPVIGLNTGCGERWLTRLWPEEYWIQLICDLQTQDCFPLLLGGPAEEAGNLRLRQATGAHYPGTFSLPRFIALAAQCRVIVTAVTMTMHIALGLGVPLVLFNNIFNPHEFELYGNGVMLQPDSGCECYFGQQCRRSRHCMYDLPEPRVLAAIMDMLQKTR